MKHFCGDGHDHSAAGRDGCAGCALLLVVLAVLALLGGALLGLLLRIADAVRGI